MTFLTDHKRKFDDLRAALHSDNRSQLKREANGGNTIILSYLPEEENLYVEKAVELFPNCQLIDLSSLFVESIDKVGIDQFKEYYENYISTPDQVFKNEEDNSFFSLIIREIANAIAANKVPFIIRTGILFGTGIENVNIMESKEVMTCGSPIVIFYPSIYQQDNLLFLNFKPASKYRCKLIK